MATQISAEKEQSFVNRLRAELLAGKYSPGEWLKQADLEADYGANRFEVRFALAELHLRGLLEHFPNRGYRVCNHTEEERVQLYEARTLLEVSACRLLVQRATPGQIAEFERLVKQFEDGIEHETREGLRDINAALHDCLYGMAANPILAAEIKGLRERGVLARWNTWDAPKALRDSSADHFEMLEAVRRRDAEALSAVVYQHLNRWRKQAKT